MIILSMLNFLMAFDGMPSDDGRIGDAQEKLCPGPDDTGDNGLGNGPGNPGV